MIQNATLLHHVPGRVRVRLPHGRYNQRLLAQVRDFVSGLHGVQQVEINTYTGTVVVHYAPEAEENLKGILPPVPGLPDILEAGKLAEEIEAEADFLARHSESALAVVNFFKDLNNGVREATGNAVDLKVLVPAGLAVWAFFKSGSEVSTPLWVTLAIVAVNSFVMLHSETAAPAIRQAS